MNTLLLSLLVFQNIAAYFDNVKNAGIIESNGGSTNYINENIISSINTNRLSRQLNDDVEINKYNLITDKYYYDSNAQKDYYDAKDFTGDLSFFEANNAKGKDNKNKKGLLKAKNEKDKANKNKQSFLETDEYDEDENGESFLETDEHDEEADNENEESFLETDEYDEDENGESFLETDEHDEEADNEKDEDEHDESFLETDEHDEEADNENEESFLEADEYDEDENGESFLETDEYDEEADNEQSFLEADNEKDDDNEYDESFLETDEYDEEADNEKDEDEHDESFLETDEYDEEADNEKDEDIDDDNHANNINSSITGQSFIETNNIYSDDLFDIEETIKDAVKKVGKNKNTDESSINDNAKNMIKKLNKTGNTESKNNKQSLRTQNKNATKSNLEDIKAKNGMDQMNLEDYEIPNEGLSFDMMPDAFDALALKPHKNEKLDNESTKYKLKNNNPAKNPKHIPYKRGENQISPHIHAEAYKKNKKLDEILKEYEQELSSDDMMELEGHNEEDTPVIAETDDIDNDDDSNEPNSSSISFLSSLTLIILGLLYIMN
ncbi:rhoptry-associated membrane antigen, putative [Plasmodium chabaudi adami]|uniref:Rhoptry-associated membrane antigen, putative n=1 Tax=Plasmodium chabaudi adami TaxID=5826 RepID=A0A1D3RTJ7_PLACE|nr:rhoptry-associated membrane antigen, putative [Plasmodium chabaudi adami]